MTEHQFDDDGYPTDETVLWIQEWRPGRGQTWYDLFAQIEPIWKYSSVGYWTQEDGEYRISTAGWSGNEQIIEALQQNLLFWVMCWHKSTRGGHYVFRVPGEKENPNA